MSINAKILEKSPNIWKGIVTLDNMLFFFYKRIFDILCGLSGVVFLKIEKYRKEWEANQKIEDDPRITKVGKLLRKTSLDEVPQFINILKGDMLLIGTHTLVEGELDAHSGNREIYEKVRLGIMGWWCNSLNVELCLVKEVCYDVIN